MIDSSERLLWEVHDDCHRFIQQSFEYTVPVDKRIDQLFLCIADLAKALAGGHREGGRPRPSALGRGRRAVQNG